MVDSLSDLTENGTITWTESDPNSKKRYFERNYYTTGDDSTQYSIDIKWTLSNEKWSLESTPSMWIKNNNLPNGMYFLYGNKYDVKRLRDVIIKNYCSDMNPSIEDIELLFEEMYNNINLSGIRDNKIIDILN